MSATFERSSASNYRSFSAGTADTVDGEFPDQVSLELLIDDREVIRALLEYPEGEERNQYAAEALKIGVVALRHVGGTIAVDQFRRDGDRFLGGLQKALEEHKQSVQTQIEAKLKEYFDPKDGRFTDRVQRLVANDGELSQLLKGFIDGENSLFARTLVAHVGRDSELMKLLDPQQSDGLLTVLHKTVDQQLADQRDHLLKEFSLDNKDGALSRFIAQLTNSHGDLSKDIQKKIDVIIKEFSLNEENSALSRLVQNVTQAQRTITNEFSLDSDTSCLSRLKKELKELLDASAEKNRQFQEEVKVSLAKIVTQREESERSTRHGLVFQDAVCEFLIRQSQHAGDMATPTGRATGLIKNCKVGDCVIELGPDSAAPGAKVAVEAKEEGGYTLARAREEIELARKNRGADWGVFVFSKKTAPPNLEPFARYGNDFIVVWDADDATSDVFLKAGVIAARALCFRLERQSAAQQVDFETIDRAILEIEKRAGNLDEVRKSAETIQSSSSKILDRVRIDREALDKQIEILRERVGDLKNSAIADS
ncbi:MAG TPA: hypothetical protein VHE81_07675 [Lacipirellulaceae bacterium]|nr:hypothetical protein [Lacipirellulaceae bacterium]